MQVILTKRLTPSEKERHYIIIPRRNRENFPPFNAVFKLKVGKQYYQTYVDSYSRLRLGSRIFNKLDLDQPGCIIVIKRDSDGNYMLETKTVRK